MKTFHSVRIWYVNALLFCVAGTLSGCIEEQDVVIQGDFKSAKSFLEGKKLYLGNAETRDFVDTAIVHKGKFDFTMNAGQNFTPFRAAILFETGNPSGPYQPIGYVNPYFKKTSEVNFYAEPGLMQLSLDTIRKYGREKNEVTFRIKEINPQTSSAFHHYAFKKDDGHSPGNRNYNRSIVAKHPNSLEVLRTFNFSKSMIENNEAKHLLSLFDADMHDNPGYKSLKSYLELENNTGTDFPTEVLLTTANDQSMKKSLIDASRHNLVVFWASWCGPCRMEIPQIKRLYENKGPALNVVSISIDKNRNAWKKALEKEQMPWKQYLLPQGETFGMLDKKYNLQTIPLWVLLDGNGKVVDQHIGYETGPNAVDLKVAALLK